MTDIEQTSIKLYSQKAILVSTFLAGPIATGILVRKNFINLGNKDYGNIALGICIAFTSLLIISIFTIPENVFIFIPNQFIPAIYTLATYFLLKKFMGKSLDEHKENNLPFYSGWNAFGVSMICLTVMLGIIAGYVFLFYSDIDTKKLEQNYEKIGKNETKALELSTIPDSCDAQFIAFIDSIGIPKWQENTLILEEMNKSNEFPEEVVKYNERLLKYYMLRIQSYQLMKKSVVEHSTKYDQELFRINMEISKELIILNKE